MLNETTVLLPPASENGHDAQYKVTVMVPKRRYLSYLRERWWLVLTCMVVAVSAVITYETVRDEAFISYAQLYLTLAPPLGMNVTAGIRDDFATRIELLKGSKLRRAALDGLGPKAMRLNPQIKVEVFRPMGTSLLVLSVTAPDGVVAQEFMKALIEEYLAFKRDTRLSTAQDWSARSPTTSTSAKRNSKRSSKNGSNFKRPTAFRCSKRKPKALVFILADMNIQLGRLRIEEELLTNGLSPEAASRAMPTNLALALDPTNLISTPPATTDVTSTNLLTQGNDLPLRTARLELAVVLAEGKG